MYRKKRTRLFVALFGVVVLIVIGGFCFSFQKKNRDTYQDIQNGERVKATVYQLPQENYQAGVKNKYLYTFVSGGKTYAASTIGKYYAEDTAEFWVRYAVDDGKVRLLGEEDTVKIGDKTYRLAVSYEDIYFTTSRPPSMTLTYAVFVIAVAVAIYAAVIAAWVARYKNLEHTGILTYGLFIEATASKTGSNRHMAIRYKFKDEDENWVEHLSPYTYTILDAEKFMALETFKIRYKGNRSMIVEDVKRVRVE